MFSFVQHSWLLAGKCRHKNVYLSIYKIWQAVSISCNGRLLLCRRHRCQFVLFARLTLVCCVYNF